MKFFIVLSIFLLFISSTQSLINSYRVSNQIKQTGRGFHPLKTNHQPIHFPNSVPLKSKLNTIKRNFNNLVNIINQTKNNISKNIKNLIATTLIFLTQMGVFNKVSYALSLPTIAITALPKASFALPFSKYSSLSALNRLSTTPVFYLTNSAGNPYLQEDVQV